MTFLKRVVLRGRSGAGPASNVRGGKVSVKFGSEASLRFHYGKRDKVYFTTLL